MKTKLGISTGLLGAAVYLFAIFGGWVALIIVAGYILLFESDEWLKKAAVKAIIINMLFSVLFSIIGINAINTVCQILNINFFMTYVDSGIIIIVNNLFMIIQKLLLLALAFTALYNKTVPLGFIDNIITKHTDNETEK